MSSIITVVIAGVTFSHADRLIDVAEWHAPVNGDAPRVRVDIDNGDGLLRAAWRGTLILMPAHIAINEDIVFSGVISEVEWSDVVSITIEPGGNALSFTQTFPLRKTTSWASFNGEEFYIPLVYGRAIVQAIPYNKDRTEWVIADHPVSRIHRVIVDRLREPTAQLVNTTDNTGVLIGMFRTAKPIPNNTKVLVECDGLPIETPGEILIDLLNRAGINCTAADLSLFIAATRSIKLGGVVSGEKTVRALVAEILQSVGAVFTATPGNVATLFPPASGVMPVSLVITDGEEGSVTWSCSTERLYGEVTVTYADPPIGAVTVKSKSPSKQSLTYEAKWLRTSADAEALAVRLASYYSVPIWTASVSLDALWLRSDHAGRMPSSGDYVHMDMVNSPPDITAATGFITDIDPGVGRDSGSFKCETPSLGFDAYIESVSSASRIQSIRQTRFALESTGTRLGVDYSAGVVRLTLLDPDNRPMDGAEVSLGNLMRFADRNGYVEFNVDPGFYPVTVRTRHGTPYYFEVSI